MELFTVNDIFTNRIFRIPSYQRGFSWSNNKPININNEKPFKDVNGQLKDLWDDIMNIESDGWHYIGLLTLVEKDCEYNWLETHKQYEIVDGQQRITSLLILLKVLIEKAQSLNFELGPRTGDAIWHYIECKSDALSANVFGYKSDNPSNDYFKKEILKIGGIYPDIDESVYTENLKNAKSFFEGSLEVFLNKEKLKNKNSSEKEHLKKLYSKVTNKLKFNQYILPSELNEFVVFETMNNRGKPLSELEKLKNRLMYLNFKLPLYLEKNHDDNLENDYNNDSENIDENIKKLEEQKQQLEKELNTSWITIYHSLGSNKEKPLDDEEFVKNHWIMFFEGYDKSEAKRYSNFLFDEYFTISRVYDTEVDYKIIHDYIESLQGSSKSWLKLNFPNFFEDEEKDLKSLVQNIHKVGFRAPFKPITLAIINLKNKDNYKILKLIEEYSFKIFDISDRQSTTGDSLLNRLAFQLYRNKKTTDDIYNDIKNHMNKYFSMDSFKNQIQELFDSGNKNGYYAWSGIKYFLYMFDLHLRKENANYNVTKHLDWDIYNKNANSIEHIFPQSCAISKVEYIEKNKKSKKSKKELQDQYDKIQKNWDVFEGFTISQKKRLVNSLGNLLAINQPLNSSLQNDCFKYKVDQSLKGEGYKKKGYKYDSMSAILVSEYSDWNAESILNRGIEMLDYLWTFLGVSKTTPLSREDKVNLLGLGFIEKKDK